MKIRYLPSFWARPVFVIAVLATAFSRQQVEAQCANAKLESMSVSANKSKCGFTEFCELISTPAKYYLQKEYIEDKANSSADWGGSGSSHRDVKEIVNDEFCTNRFEYSGHAHFNGDSRPPPAPTPHRDPGAPYDYTGTMNSDGSWDDDGDAYALVYDAGYDLGFLGYTTTSSCSSAFFMEHSSGSGTDSAGAWSNSGSSSVTLSSEYTDDMLRGYIIGHLPSYPTGWGNGSGKAYYTIDGNHSSAEGGKMKYRFHVTDCKPHESYSVKWKEVTTYPDGRRPSVQKMKEKVEGGDPSAGVYTSIHEVDMPSQPCAITVTGVKITSGPPGQGGSGGGGK